MEIKTVSKDELRQMNGKEAQSMAEGYRDCALCVLWYYVC